MTHSSPATSPAATPPRTTKSLSLPLWLCYPIAAAAIAILLLLPFPAHSQPAVNLSGLGTVVRSSPAPADTAYQYQVDVVSATVSYLGYAPSNGPSKTLTVSTITSANPGAVTITAHGYNTNVIPMVYITGGTGDWTAVNGWHLLTYSDANTFTIDVNTLGFAAFAGQVLTVTTRAVSTTDAYWTIYKEVKDGSGNIIFRGWPTAAANATTTIPVVGGSTQFRFAWGSRASYGYQ